MVNGGRAFHIGNESRVICQAEPKRFGFLRKNRRMECPVCDFSPSESQYQLPDRLLGDSAELFQLYRCPNCGSVFQSMEGIRDRISQFYPEGYWWDDSGGLSRLERIYREAVVRLDHLRFLKSVFPSPDNRRLLDIGCGSAVFLKLAKEAGFDAFGLDFSEQAARLAAQEVPERVFCGTVEDLIEASEFFDILVLLHTLEHVLDPFQYLKKIRKMVRRPGGLIIQVPNVGSYQASVLGSRWYGLDCPRHLCNFTQYSLLHLLGRCGFRIERVRHFSLRDNAAAMVSSLLPGLDPIAQRIRTRGQPTKLRKVSLAVSESFYFALVLAIQPLAWMESKLGRGGTLTVYATLS